MHHDLRDKLSFEYEMFRVGVLSQSRESIFTRSSEIFYKSRIFRLLNDMNSNGYISFDLKQKIMIKEDIIDSIYMYLMESNYEETDMEKFITDYLIKNIEPMECL